MIPSYNSYRHEQGECDISLTIERVENEARQVTSEINRIRVAGMLCGTSTAAAMDKKFARLLAAYSVNGYDFKVFLPGGQILSQLSLASAPALGGVRIIRRPSIESLRNAAYTTYLPYTIELEAEYPAAGAGSLLREFSESLIREGGQSLRRWQYPLVGSPVQQVVRKRDTYRARQVGFAVGAYDYPIPASPLWPAARIDNRQPTKTSPRRRGAFSTDFRIEWDYEFESLTPLLGDPHTWT
jgi:hypothetical protein